MSRCAEPLLQGPEVASSRASLLGVGASRLQAQGLPGSGGEGECASCARTCVHTQRLFLCFEDGLLPHGQQRGGSEVMPPRARTHAVHRPASPTQNTRPRLCKDLNYPGRPCPQASSPRLGDGGVEEG